MGKINKTKFKKAVVGTGGIMIRIARNMDCTRDSVYKFCKKYPDMMQLRRDEEEKIVDVGEIGLFERVKSGEIWALKYILATKGKNRGYSERTELDIAGNQAVIINLIEKSIEEIKDDKPNNKS